MEKRRGVMIKIVL